MQDTITVQANATRAVTVSGKFLSIIAATAQFKVEMDGEGQNVALTGSQFSTPNGFRRLVFTETQGAANTITFDAGDSPSPSRPVAVQAVAATLIGANSNQYSQVGSNTKQFPGVDAQGRHRKTITVTNQSSTALLAINSGAGNQIMTVYPKTISPAIETDDTIGILTDTVGSLYCVLEIYYSKPLQNDQ